MKQSTIVQTVITTLLMPFTVSAMRNAILSTVLLATSFTASAKMAESECYALQSEIYKHADAATIADKERHLELSMKLTEECGYLMTQEVLEQRRAYNYLLYKQLDK